MRMQLEIMGVEEEKDSNLFYQHCILQEELC